jgi:ubiquinone/menaquinone biosynthesis C-methylase UbiE
MLSANRACSVKFDDIVCTACHKYGYCKEYKEINRKNITSNGRQSGEPSPIRKCQFAICELYYTKIKDKDVLEVGCGNKKKGELIKKIVKKNNCNWTGVDIKKTDLTTYVCSADNMPFEDNSFDCVIGSQTLEHWKKPLKVLKEIHRILRPAGKVYLTAPIHLHGRKIFVSGDFDAIEKLFLKSGFDIEKIERWRKNYCDLEPFFHTSAKKYLRYVKKCRGKAKTSNYEKPTIYAIHCILKKNYKNET